MVQGLLLQSQPHCTFCKTARPLSVVRRNLKAKYLTGMDYYHLKQVNDIVYNELTHLVSVFKDYLIYDDVSEFLKRTYTYEEVLTRLPKIYAFYEKYSKVFPNYIGIPEKRYMFKNIERKQRAIDEKQKHFIAAENREGREEPTHTRKRSNLSQCFDENDMLFDSKFIDSFNRIVPHPDPEEQRLRDEESKDAAAPTNASRSRRRTNSRGAKHGESTNRTGVETSSRGGTHAIEIPKLGTRRHKPNPQHMEMLGHGSATKSGGLTVAGEVGTTKARLSSSKVLF